MALCAPVQRSAHDSPLATILYRDRWLVVVDKPAGLLVHRGWGDDEVVAMTLVRDAIGAYVYPAHRLDRGTSGALVFALDATTAAGLQAAFAGGAVDKRYLALVRGVPGREGVIDHAIPRREGGERVAALTSYRRLAVSGHERCSLVEASPKTGRLHQVRRHLKHIGHPIIGDANYGKGVLNRHYREKYGLGRLALHASSVAFDHPAEGRALRIEAPLPPDFAAPLSALELRVDPDEA